MLPNAHRDRLDVVLVSPRNPLNIGAAARAMANFGFERLAVVAPFAPNWREARSAIGAPDQLLNAAEYPTLGEAVAACTLVVGTGSLTYRKPEQRVVQLPVLAPLVRQQIEQGGRVALVFGPEKHGLTREDLSFCHILVEIPTDPRQPSMNLGQAVAVCLYELAAHAFRAEEASCAPAPLAEDPGTEVGRHVAASGDLELLATVIDKAMVAVDYSPATMRDKNSHDMRLLLRRLGLGRLDTRRILGLFRRILWRLEH